LAPYRSGAGRLGFAGPALDLDPKQALALAILELATNAVKYGALSDHGRVDIAWSNDWGDGQPKFQFVWTESGGPPVKQPDAKKTGFGSRLIERILPNDFGGKVTTTYGPAGLVCTLVAANAILPEKAAGL
jgi:two-component sensor histidine kinase